MVVVIVLHAPGLKRLEIYLAGLMRTCFIRLGFVLTRDFEMKIFLFEIKPFIFFLYLCPKFYHDDLCVFLDSRLEHVSINA